MWQIIKTSILKLMPLSCPNRFWLKASLIFRLFLELIATYYDDTVARKISS
jgi:hypothetical protein